MNVLEIRELDRTRDTAWDAFVRAAPSGTFLHLSAWRTILTDEFGCRCHYLYAERDHEIVGVLPLAHVKNVIAGNVLVSLPFLVYGGPVGEPAAMTALVARARELGVSLGVDYVELRNRDAGVDGLAVRESHVTFRRELGTVDESLKAIPRKQRAMIRKGEAAGIDVSWNADIDRFYAVFSESYRNLGTPVFARSLFRRLIETFGDQVWLTTLEKEGQPLASVQSFVFRDEVLPYFGGGTAQARDHYANDLMYWVVMVRAIESGLRSFDFGRSKVDSGSYRFKKHWGFEPTPLRYQHDLIKAHVVPNLSPTNPKFKAPIEVWKRLPLALTRVVGPTIARRLI